LVLGSAASWPWLIVIIAIGESLVAIGLGARGTGLRTGFTIRAQQLLTDRSGTPRMALARDWYTYLHLPMIAGIVLFAFTAKTTIAHVADELAAAPALCLCGGPALYLLA
jgi:low temperature requirement protein LtrA